MSDAFPSDVPDSYPPPVDELASPECHAAAPAYLGSSDWEASRLDAVAMWPTEQQWNNGDRWFACLLAERSPKEKPVPREGSLYGAFTDGLGVLQACLKGEPKVGGPNPVISCDEPHRSEAIPDVLNLGDPDRPAPPFNEMFQRTLAHCANAIVKYLGGEKQGVRESALMPHPDQWSSEHHTAVCYAVSDKMHTGTLSGAADRRRPADTESGGGR